MWPISIAVCEAQLAAAVRARVPLAHLAQVGEARLEVAAGLHAAQMPVVAVRPDDELALPQRLVGDDLDRDAHRPDRPAVRAECLADLVRIGGPEPLPERGEQLHLVEPVVAPDEGEHDLAVRHDGHRLRRRPLVDAQEPGERPRSSAGQASRPPAAPGAASGKSGAGGIPPAISRSAA